MSKFKLKETSLTIRDTEVRVRELTQKERRELSDRIDADKFMGPAIIAELGVLDPKMTAVEWHDESPEVLQLLTDEIMKLSQMNSKTDKDGKVAPEKEPDAS